MERPIALDKERIRRHNMALAKEAEKAMFKQRQDIRFKDPTQRAFEDTILAQQRGKDLQDNPLFHK